MGLSQSKIGRVASFVSVFALATIFNMSPALASLKVGDPAPKILTSTLNGNEFSVDAYKGKVIVVHFWATWCPGCKKEMPLLNQFYQKNHEKKLEMIALSVDRARDRKEVLKLMPQFSYPLAMITDAKTNGFGSPEILPMTYVIDSKGMIAKVFKGTDEELTERNLNDAFQSGLKPTEPVH